ncbi:enkurin isoform 2-T2 [Spinachia spinachia]
MSEPVYPAESVYNLIPKEAVHPQKPQRYMSKYRPTVLLEEKATKDAIKTMGPAKVDVPSPEKYLKKHSKEPKLHEKTRGPKEVRHIATAKKPAVPARTDKPAMGIHTQRDFIKTATALPTKPRPTCVDTRRGHKQLLENSGLVPKYIKKKHYGEVPQYLRRLHEEEIRAQEKYDHLVKEQREKRAMKHLTEEERGAALKGLKKSWDELHQEYQGLSFVADNQSKKSHRLQLEVAMKQLEDDIGLFERFKTIYIPPK